MVDEEGDEEERISKEGSWRVEVEGEDVVRVRGGRGTAVEKRDVFVVEGREKSNADEVNAGWGGGRGFCANGRDWKRWLQSVSDPSWRVAVVWTTG